VLGMVTGGGRISTVGSDSVRSGHGGGRISTVGSNSVRSGHGGR